MNAAIPVATSTMVQSFKTFYFCNFCDKLECLSLLLGKPASLVKCLQVRPGAYTRVEHLKGASPRWALALLANIRLSWKGLSGKINQAY